MFARVCISVSVCCSVVVVVFVAMSGCVYFCVCLLCCCSVCSYVCVCVCFCLSVVVSLCVFLCLLFCLRVCLSVSVFSAWWFAFVSVCFTSLFVFLSNSSCKTELAWSYVSVYSVYTHVRLSVCKGHESAVYDPRAPGNGSQISSVGRRYWAFSPRLPHWPTHPAATSALLDEIQKNIYVLIER